jgi:hypothetical protein
MPDAPRKSLQARRAHSTFPPAKTADYVSPTIVTMVDETRQSGAEFHIHMHTLHLDMARAGRDALRPKGRVLPPLL